MLIMYLVKPNCAVTFTWLVLLAMRSIILYFLSCKIAFPFDIVQLYIESSRYGAAFILYSFVVVTMMSTRTVTLISIKVNTYLYNITLAAYHMSGILCWWVYLSVGQFYHSQVHAVFVAHQLVYYNWKYILAKYIISGIFEPQWLSG